MTSAGAPVHVALYSDLRMIRRLIAFLLLLLTLLFCGGWGVQRGHIKATVLTIEERTRDRVLLYQVNTPIMTEDHYLAVSIEVKGMRYDGEFMPRRANDPLPSFWKNEEVVLTRIEKHYFYLKRPDGKETRFEIVHKSQVRTESTDKP